MLLSTLRQPQSNRTIALAGCASLGITCGAAAAGVCFRPRRGKEEALVPEAAELGNVPTPTAASGTSASSLPLLGLKQTPAAAAPQVLPKDSHPARAGALGLPKCAQERQTSGAATPDAGGGPDAGVGPDAGGMSDAALGPDDGGRPDAGGGSDTG